MMPSRSRFTLLLVAGLAISDLSAQAPPPKAADAAELELLELLNTPITGASKRAQRLLDSPQAIEVVTGEDIRQMGIYRVQDALRLMTSVDIIEADNGFSVVGMRGILQEGQPRTVQILIDGVPLYTAFGGSVDVNNIPIPVDLIERIEVVRGPSSTLYGANAVAGVVAISTRKLDKGLHGEMRVSGADKSTARGAANFRWSDGNLGLVAGYSGSSLGNSGYSTYKVGGRSVPTNWITFDGNTGQPLHQSDKSRQYQGYARLEWLKDDTSLWLSAGQAYKWLSPMGAYPLVASPTSVSLMNYRFYTVDTLLLGWRQTWTPTFSTEARLHRMRSRDGAGASPVLSVVVGDPAWNSETTWGDFISDQIDLQANWNPMDTLHFIFGADAKKMTFGKDPTHGLLQEEKESAVGGFASMDWNTSPSTTLSLAFRVENETLGGSRISPRAAYVWNPSPSSTLRFAFLTSTRSPQYMEQRVNFASRYPAGSLPTLFSILPNPDLKPEKTSNFEIGYRQMIGGVTLDLTVYQMKITNLISPEITAVTPQAPYPDRVDTKYANKMDATNRGAELTATYMPVKGWTVGFNLGYVDFKKDNPMAGDPTGEAFAYTPELKANLWTKFQRNRFHFYVALQHVGKTDVEALQVYGAPLFDTRDAYFQYHAKAGYEVLDGLTLSAFVRNGAREFTPQGATGVDRPVYYYAMRREYGGSVAFRF